MMPEKFRNTYRIASHRKPGWDYSSDGMYFITLVTEHRVCNLGEISVEQKIGDSQGRAYCQLSEFGKIVDAEWHKSFEIRDELLLDEYIIMPNHLHAIVMINNRNRTTVDENGADGGMVAMVVETHGRASLQPLRPPQHDHTFQRILPPFQRLPKSISSFLAGFKSAVNSKIDDYIDQQNLNIPKYNRNNHFFQPNYYDHIIRNELSYYRILDYIISNPAKWADDKFYSK